MNCAAVRDLLPEHALGVGDGEVAEIEKHLSWCAACRKEARDLERAAGMMAFALAPSEPDPELQERIVQTVGRAARRPARSAAGPHRGRRAAVIVLAAAVALAGLGAGAVLARRGDHAAELASQAQQQQGELARFRRFIQNAAFVDPGTEAALGNLKPRGKGPARGSALTIVSPSVPDQVIVIVSGLKDGSEPLSVTLVGPRGRSLLVARIRSLDAGGGATVADLVRDDLSGYKRVVVRDAAGHVVLSGTLGAEAPVSTPTP